MIEIFSACHARYTAKQQLMALPEFRSPRMPRQVAASGAESSTTFRARMLVAVGVGALVVGLVAYSLRPQAQPVVVPTPIEVAALASEAGPGEAVRPSGRSTQSLGGGTVFANPPLELSNSSSWVQNFRPTRLWSTDAADATDFGDIPQWTYLQYSGESSGTRARVIDRGDGTKRPPHGGWVDAADIGPAGNPATEWYLGVGESEQSLPGAPKRITSDWPAAFAGQDAVVIDGETGAVLFGKNARRRTAMASCTKMVTAIIALERGRLDDKVTVDVDGLQMAIEMESTVMGLKPGDTLTLETLLYGLMLPSGNDAAVAIARHIAGSEDKFVDLMNQKVRDLGLTDTQFKNPHGLDSPGHFSTPYDQAIIGRYGMRMPAFARLAGAKEYTGDGFALYNVNRLLWNYPGADGIKPGFTDDAGSALVASATRDGHRVISAVIKANSAAIDTTPLLDWAFRSFRWS